MDFLPCSLRLKVIHREGNKNREKRFLIKERVYENKIRTIENYVNAEAQKLCNRLTFSFILHTILRRRLSKSPSSLSFDITSSAMRRSPLPFDDSMVVISNGIPKNLFSED